MDCTDVGKISGCQCAGSYPCTVWFAYFLSLSFMSIQQNQQQQVGGTTTNKDMDDWDDEDEDIHMQGKKFQTDCKQLGDYREKGAAKGKSLFRLSSFSCPDYNWCLPPCFVSPVCACLFVLFDNIYKCSRLFRLMCVECGGMLSLCRCFALYSVWYVVLQRPWITPRKRTWA